MRTRIPIAIIFAVCFFASAVGAQTGTPTDPSEEYDLAITEKRITEDGLERGSVLRLESERVSVAVGAWIRTGRIDVTLRGVTGHVRFRVSLDAVRRRLPALRTVVSEAR